MKGTTAAVLAVTLVFTLMSLTASADPGGGDKSAKIYGEQIESIKVKLPGPKSGGGGGGIQPNSDYYTELGGGVTAISTAGMQWGASPFGEDVRGLTRSYTTSAIGTVHTHGALVQHGDANASNCYEGDLRWTPDITLNNTQEANSGWGSWFAGFHDCWVMATGHYYIRNGVRTDIWGPDIIKKF